MAASTKNTFQARLLSLVGLAAGVLIVVALAAQIADQVARDSFAPERYFSYFSIQTSIANAVFLIASGVSRLRGSPESARSAGVRACLVAFAVMTGVVYEVVLRGGVEQLDGSQRLLDWPIDVTHVWIPIYFVIDWVIRRDRPPLSLTFAAWGAVYPAAWFVFSLGRGALTGWYPYDFMDPTLPGGIGAVALAVSAIAALYAASMAIVLGINRLHHRSS